MRPQSLPTQLRPIPVVEDGIVAGLPLDAVHRRRDVQGAAGGRRVHEGDGGRVSEGLPAVNAAVEPGRLIFQRYY